jgi:signal transduction histidine kinase/CheY-like chemotaxis protein
VYYCDALFVGIKIATKLISPPHKCYIFYWLYRFMAVNSNPADAVVGAPQFYPHTEEIFRAVFDFFGTLDLNGRVLSLEGSIFEQTKTDPKLLIGQPLSETVFWQASENTSRTVDEAIERSSSGQQSKIIVDFRVSSDKKVAVEIILKRLKQDGQSDCIFFCGQQITRRQKTVEYYKTEVEELLFAAENAEIGLWFWDLKSGNIYATPKCNDLFDIPAYDRLTYDRIIQAVHPDDRDRVTETLQKAHINGTKYTEEFRVQYGDDRVEWLSAEGKSFLDDSGEPEKMTSVVRKITEQKLADEELVRVYDREKKARDEAEEANRSKDFFLAFVSHELRSPLNAILGWSKILLSRPVDDDTRRSALETIEKSARSQTKLINDLVDSARVASGKISLEFRPMNLYEVVKVSYISQKPAADLRNITLEFNAESQNVTIFGDANRLQQVFVNLISNAIKFTGEGGLIKVKLTASEDLAEVTVSDNGRGISADSLPNIFRQFSQVQPVNDISKGGLGLGLSIAKILVGKHGGMVFADSPGVGMGSTFVVRLPLRAGEVASEEPITATVVKDSMALKGLRILVVEDDNDSREVLQLFLEQTGAIVESFGSAREAFEVFQREPASLPDLIISDLAMPGEDGYSFISRIRQLSAERGGHLPAVALSAFATNESKQRAIECGFDFYSSKPFEPDLLTNDILNLIQKKTNKTSV